MNKILELIKQAGVVGCGGAGFPTHKKLACTPQYFIINGIECEPLLQTDCYLMRHYADKLVFVADQIMLAIGAEQCVIALKETYQTEIKAIQAAINNANSRLSIHTTASFYPAGDEQVLIAEITGRSVPPTKIPIDVGCVVSNVATCIAIWDALHGVAFTEKYLTVSGAVVHPTVMRVPVGISVLDCIELAGGAQCSEWMAVDGGPIMGKRMSQAEASISHITKLTSGILIFPMDSLVARKEDCTMKNSIKLARFSCIQCRLCTDLCPRYLLGHPLEPHKIMRSITSIDDIEAMVMKKHIQTAMLCSECGICELYACPMGLQPRKVNAMLKRELAMRGIRFKPPENHTSTVNALRNGRLIPTKRLAARAGVLPWYSVCNADDIREYTPKTVTLALKQNIGVAAVPSVQDGEAVLVGQQIAACPRNSLGANLHASISGNVKIESEQIIIESEERV